MEGLRFSANAGVGGVGDHQKLETKPRSRQDNPQTTLRFKNCCLQPTLAATIDQVYCTVVQCIEPQKSSTVVVQ